MKYKSLFDVFKVVNEKVIHIMKRGIAFSSLLCILATFILSLYCVNAVPSAFYIGISLLKSSMFFVTMFLVCGVIFSSKSEN